MCPPLLKYDTIEEYKEHYELYYCKSPIVTLDGIRIFFPKEKFTHAFYESSQRNRNKDVFSTHRSERMDWIKKTLEHKDAILYKGWDKDAKEYLDDRRVSIVYEDFIVVVSLSLNSKGNLKGNFITCYKADNSIDSINKSPVWDKKTCIENLERIKRLKEQAKNNL